MVYPLTLPSYTTKTNKVGIVENGDTSRVFASHVNGLQDDVVALATKVGIGADAPAVDEFFKGTGAGSSGWGALTSSDVTTALGYTPNNWHQMVVIADDQAGLNLGAKINAADVLLGALSGTILVLQVGTISTAVSLSAGHELKFNPGTFPQSAAITLNGNGACVRGAGVGSTILSNTSTTAPSIAITGGVLNFTIEHLKLFRNAVPTSSAHGISQLATTDGSLISNVVIEGHYYGMLLGPCGYARAQNITLTKNLSHGLYLLAISSWGALQWTLFDIAITQNGGDGVRVESVAGPTHVTMGTWSKILTFANSGRGCSILGSSGVPIHGVRMDGCLWSEDGDHEVYFDSYGGNHRINGSTIVLAGGIATGPTLATAASNTGHGIMCTANNTDIVIVGNKIKWNSHNGIECQADHATITGNDVIDNGRAAAGGFAQKGINVNCASGATVAGNSAYSDVETGQLYGIFSILDTAVVVGNTVRGVTEAMHFNAGPTASCVVGNRVLSGTAGAAVGRAHADQAAAPAGGTGATAGAYDTAAHRDAMIALVNQMRSVLVANGLMKGAA